MPTSSKLQPLLFQEPVKVKGIRNYVLQSVSAFFDITTFSVFRWKNADVSWTHGVCHIIHVNNIIQIMLFKVAVKPYFLWMHNFSGAYFLAMERLISFGLYIALIT